MADAEEEFLLQANLFLLLALKRRHRQFQNRRKHRFWVRKIFLKRQELGAFNTLVRELRVFDREYLAADKLNFSPIFSQQLTFLFLSLKSLLLRW